MSAEGVSPNKNNIKAITELNIPKSQKQIKQFLGATGYYRKFIKDYSKIAYPMVKYLKKDCILNINDPDYIKAFQQLKTLITNHPVLQYPDFDKTFKIQTDAGNNAIGAVILQNGLPIAYTSRTLNEHKVRYSATERNY